MRSGLEGWLEGGGGDLKGAGPQVCSRYTEEGGISS